MLVWFAALAAVAQISLCSAQGSFSTPKPFSGKLGDASDLTNFVTRPDIKAPLFNVTQHKPERILLGYWFVAPYVSLVREPVDAHYYQPCQIGPLIYDGAGNLVWSGACLLENPNAVDFHPFHADGRDYLSMILYSQTPKGIESSKAIVMDDSLQVSSTYELGSESGMSLNMHEFNVIDNGKTVLHLTKRSIERDITGVKQSSTSSQTGRIVDNGFVEVDLASKKILFEWWAADHVPLTDSSGVVSGLTQKAPQGWNWIHMNSVDKNEEGDYMVCARYTDAIYKISGKDGRILWTLGGRSSSFKIPPDLDFSRQHDARFISSSGTEEVISFLDNGGDDHGSTSSASSGLLVSLNTASMTANIINRWPRPSGEITKQRGNFQVLPNGNVFAGWSDNAHISEHSAQGALLMEARWTSERFATYRAWKANFTSIPAERPVVKAFIFGTSKEDAILGAYVSWNGATEVDDWRFYGIGRDGQTRILGRMQKTGFETLFQMKGCVAEVYAEAISRDGRVLGKSAAVPTLDADKICSVDSGQSEDILTHFELPRTSYLNATNLFWIACIAAVLAYAWRTMHRWKR
ncbi:hypothetical protein CKM354_001036000 [Cercospora kikuchii]|uniref:Arylsulfotransferase n=1 Tax=Cercospora kikuchii TaxID=84275 RepID=A0A9P3CYY1_9PEZI|nr:uncharacterized protein CKM354_001036000 [Cercospora kikuchii]GIZ47263.1 hypothetical protein CKM354_001036000 [Cercospora kikuchii]